MKNVKFLLALALVLVAVFALASCDCDEHQFAATATVEATCTAGGSVTYTCSECDATYTEYTSRLDHTYTDKVVEATCTELGYTEHTCACGRSFKDSYTAKKAHSYTSAVTAATCTADGYTTYTCSACGNSYKDDYTDATGHTYAKQETVPAQCGNMGYTVYACTCGDSYKSDLVAALIEHTYVATTVAPTHSENGYTEYTCTCGNSYKADILPALGHTYTVTTTPATCTEDGKTVSTCTCGDVVTVVLPATGHKIAELVELKDSNCSEDGVLKYKCACGEIIEEIFTAPGHLYFPEYVRGASCTEGTIIYTCSCGSTYSEESSRIDAHSWVFNRVRDLTVEEENMYVPYTEPIGREILRCKYCSLEKDGAAVYVYANFKNTSTFQNETTNPYAYYENAKYMAARWNQAFYIYAEDRTNSFSNRNLVEDRLSLGNQASRLQNFTISFGVQVKRAPTRDITGTYPETFFALAWEYEGKYCRMRHGLALDKDTEEVQTGVGTFYELKYLYHTPASNTKAAEIYSTGYYMRRGAVYDIQLEYRVGDGFQKVTIFISDRYGADKSYHEIGTFTVPTTATNPCYYYFGGADETIRNTNNDLNNNITKFYDFKVTAPFGDYYK